MNGALNKINENIERIEVLGCCSTINVDEVDNIIKLMGGQYKVLTAYENPTKSKEIG